MRLTNKEWLRASGWMWLGLCWICVALPVAGNAQVVNTTTVQGTVYLATGQVGAGLLNVSWPSFTTSSGQAVLAGYATSPIAADGFVSVNLAPNLGSMPAGLYYTATYQMSDGTRSTEYWVVPAAAQVALGQVRAQLMPAVQAVQAVNKAYVDQSIAALNSTQLLATGGTLSGPLYLSSDPTQPLQAADKHYVDTTIGASALGGTVSAGSAGQIAYYAGNGASIGGLSAVPVAAGGTGAATAGVALSNLGGAALTGATFTGQVNAPAMEGTLQADQKQSQSGSNDGIAMSLAQCATQAYACSIVAPALYSQVEAQPWSGLQPLFTYGSTAPQGPSAAQPNAGVLDQRYGVPQWFFNGSKAYDNRHYMPPLFSMSSIAQPQGTNAQTTPALLLQNMMYAGGRNFTNSGVLSNGDKVNVASLLIGSYRFTQAQTGGDLAQNVFCFGNGDCVGHDIETVSYGGPSTQSDEGNESMRYMAYEDGRVFGATAGTITPGSDGSETVTTTAQTFNGFQGEDRILIDLSGKYNAGYISGMAQAGGNEVLSCSGCNWSTINAANPTSSQTALVVQVANAGSTNTFPQSNVNLQVGSSAGFSAAPGKNLACVWDFNYECELVTAVPDGTHVTLATVRMPHPAGSYVTTGGLAGFTIEMEADRVIPGSGNGITSPVDSYLRSTVRYAVPIMMSSGNSATVFGGYNSLPGSGGGYYGRAYHSMGSGGTATLTVAGGVVTGVTCSGGTGYNSNAVPQVTVSAPGSTTAPTVWVTGVNGGGLGTCGFTPGAGVSTATGAVVPTNAYDIYPSAKVWSVLNTVSGKVDGTLYTEPFAGTFSGGDALEEPHYFLQKVSGGMMGVGQYIPAQSSNPNFGLSYTLGGAWQNSDFATTFANETDPSVYVGNPNSAVWTPGRGQWIPPGGHVLLGNYSFGLRMDTPPSGPGQYGYLGTGGLKIECGNVACSNWTSGYNVLNVQNGSLPSQDVLHYTPSNSTWMLTAGATGSNGSGAGSTFSFGPSGASLPNLTTSQLNGSYTAGATSQLQSLITAAGANGDVSLPCGTWTVPTSGNSALLISNANVHLHGASRTCTTISFTGSPSYGLEITGSGAEVSGITFTGATQETVYTVGASNVRLHDFAVSGGGAASSAYPDGAVGISGGSDVWVTDYVLTGNGAAQSGTSGSCLNYVSNVGGNNMLTAATNGGTWGAASCPNGTSYDVWASGVTRLHVLRGTHSGNNDAMGIAAFSGMDGDIRDNVIDGNNAYLNDTSAHAEGGQGYGITVYGANHLSCPLSRASNVVTGTCALGTTIPYSVGQKITLDGTFGTTTDFDGDFTVTSISNNGSGTLAPTLTWNQSAPNDAASSVDMTNAVTGTIANNKVNNTAGNGIYAFGMVDGVIQGNRVTNAGQLMPSTQLCQGGIGANASDRVSITGNTIENAVTANPAAIAGQVYSSDGICIASTYNPSISGNTILNFTNAGIDNRGGFGATVGHNTVDGGGTGVYGIATATNSSTVSGFTVGPGNGVRGVTTVGISMGMFATGWGMGNSIIGNEVAGNTATTPTTYGIQSTGSFPINISGNHLVGGTYGVSNTMTDGIYLNNSQSSVMNNIFSGMHSYPYMDHGTNNRFEGNTVYNSVNIFDGASSTRATVRNNAFIGNSGFFNLGTSTLRSGNQFSTGASSGTCTLAAGSCTVSTAEIQAGDNVRLSNVGAGGTVGLLSRGTITAGVSFLINSSSSTDSSVVFWEIVH